MTKNNGKRFENSIKESAIKVGLLFERFKDNGKFNYSDKTRFSSENPCDAFIHDGSTLYYLELKSTIGTSISFNQPPFVRCKQQVMIKPSQVQSLLDRAKYPNVYCGLLLDYADRHTKKGVVQGGTYFVEIETFVGWCSTHSKKSINQSDAELIGIKVDRKLKRVNYDYDVEKLLKDIKSQYNAI